MRRLNSGALFFADKTDRLVGNMLILTNLVMLFNPSLRQRGGEQAKARFVVSVRQ